MQSSARRSALYCIIVAVFFVATTGCDSQKRTQTLIDSLKLNPKDTLTIALPNFPANLDWAQSTDRSSSVIESNLMVGLTDIEVQGSDMKVVPALAESWDVADNGLKYTFKLKEGVVWTDGVPLKAQQFVDAFKRLLESNSPWADSLFGIRNARLFLEKKDRNFGDAGIRAPNDSTLVFELTSSESFFPGIFAHHSLYPVRQDLIDKFKEDWTLAENLATVGAYKAVKIQKGRLVVLQRNDKFPLKRAKIQNMVLRFGLKSAEELDLFSAGQINAIVDIPVTDLKIFQDRDDLYFSPILDLTYLTFDIREKPLQNPIFRRVVAMSIDREEVVSALFGSVRALSSMVPPGLTGYESNRGVRFDPEAAKELQKRSGYTSWDKYGSFYLKTDDSGPSRLAAESIRDQLKRAIGLNVEIAKMKDDTGKNPTMVLTHWWANFPDPDSFLSLFSSASLNNITGWKNRNYDDFIRNAASVTSNESKEKLYAKALHILTETEMPVVPLFIGTEYCLLQKKVRHFPLNILGQLSLRGVTLE